MSAGLPIKIFAIFAFLLRSACAYIEYVEVSNCESCTLMLTCRHLNSVIAVFNATFEPFDENSLYFSDFNNYFPPIYPRLALNRRCSGVNHCSFILKEDCAGADRWGPGNFTVKYACLTERKVTRYCNDNITLPAPEAIGVSEGFVRNPGYPKFYLGRETCRWKIFAPPMQRIKLTVLDLSLVGSVNRPENCLDSFEVKESENVVFSSCIEQEPPTEIISVGDSLEINLKASESLVARRGVLFHYTAVGCPTPESPRDGYLVYRNDTEALFTCCVGFAFPDSHERNKELKCLGHAWDHPLPLPDCINFGKDLFTRELKPVVEEMTESLSGFQKSGEEETTEDVMVPSIIILALFIINSIIVFVIYKYKKRKVAQYTEEELGRMPAL